MGNKVMQIGDDFRLDEENVPLKEERVIREEIKIGKLLKTIDMAEAVPETKDTKRIRKHRQDNRGRRVKITFKMECTVVARWCYGR